MELGNRGGGRCANNQSRKRQELDIPWRILVPEADRLRITKGRHRATWEQGPFYYGYVFHDRPFGKADFARAPRFADGVGG